MLRIGSVVALLSASLALIACGDPRKGAAEAAQGLLTAVQSGDRQAFEAHLDRPALRGDLRAQMEGVARQNGVDVPGGPSDFALDRMIDPEAFRLVQAHGGQPLPKAPSPAQVAALIKPIDKAHACVHDLTPQQRCVLTFAKEKPGWKLVGMPAADITVAVGDEPVKAGS
jgi:Protein of unknown function (DUF2939)